MSGETTPCGGLDVFEVFLQTGSSTQLSHVGSLLATGSEQAWRLARETYARRDDAVRLWVIRRDRVHSAEADGRRLLDAKTRMPYRLPSYPQERRRRRSGLRTPERRRQAPSATAPARRPATDRSLVGKEASGTLWAAMADDLFLHAHRLGEHTVDYTELEEALAVGSIAQEDLAHARTLLALLGWDEQHADTHFFDRPAAQWQPTVLTASPRADRVWSVARGLILAAGTAAALLSAVDALAGTPDHPEADLRIALEAMADEQKLHLAHWASRAALYDRPTHRQELTEALTTAAAAAGDLFGMPRPNGLPDTAPGHGAPALPALSPDILTKRFQRLLHGAGLAVGLVPALPCPPRPRANGDSLIEDERAALDAVLADLRSVRAGYPRGAFL
ncbi:Phenylacetic acid catabolic protein [Streptomyces sp. NPDC093018]|uniref:Phenylacetic acid catabolic protein n=1 Tax=Streptomyces sp. NPDC093018 TaxID=3155067 RepID=UPI003435DC81